MNDNKIGMGLCHDSRQKLLLKKAEQEGVTRYNRKLSYLPIATPWGKEMASQLLPRLSESIGEWATSNAQRKAGVLVAQCKKMTEGDMDAIAYIVMRHIFSAMGEERSLTSTAIEVANAVESEIEGKKAWKRIPEGVKRKLKETVSDRRERRRSVKVYRYYYANFGYCPEWTLKERCRLGIILVNIFKQVSGLIEFVNVAFGSKRLRTHIVLTEEARGWIRDYNEVAELLKPVRYPTVIKPLEWKNNDLWSGGYPDLISYPLVKIRRRSDSDALKKADISPVMEAVNALQGVPWKINQRVLEAMRDYHRMGLNVNEVVPFSGVIPIPPYDPEDKDPERKKEYKRQAFHIHLTNFQNKTKAFLVAKLLCTAESLKNEESIYFPIQLDFRGRMYCFTELLHYQGDDTARGLLLFAEGKRLGEDGLRWMAIHGANKFGLDKTPFEQRLEWVSKNMENIKRCAADPVSYNWWTLADDPWQFLAFCMDYAEATPDTISHLPCSLDATNNGLQILSMLMRDEEGARLTNVISGEVPNDLYQAVAETLIENLHAMAEEGDAQARVLLDTGLVSRKLVKVPVMTIPYGVTRWGITRYLDSTLAKELFNNPEAQKILPMSQRREMSKWLTAPLITAMEPYLGKSRVAMEWLKTAVTPIAEKGKPIQWTSPSGFLINNDYRKYKEQEVVTSLGDRFDYRQVLEELPEMDTKSTIRTIAPNFIHSLDASVAHKVSRLLAAESIHFGIVHDCFFSHASNLSRVRDVVRQQYGDVFIENQLELFRQQLLEQSCGDEIEKIPELGKFSIDEVPRSEYFLS
jgi:DNA-directed RNA polymerase